METPNPPSESIAPQVPTGPDVQPDFPNPMDPPPAPNPLEGTSFESVDQMAAAYKSLQAEYTKLKQTPPPEPPAQPEPVATPAEQPAESTSQPPEFDWGAATEHFDAEKGWDEKATAHFEAIGLPKQLADDYVKLQSIAQQHFKMVASQMVGGEENLQTVLSFVGENMPEVAPDLNDPNKFTYVIEAAMARMQREGQGVYAPAPNPEPTGAPQASNVRGETGPILKPGTPEAQRALADPRYYHDMDYQDRVNEALARGSR